MRRLLLVLILSLAMVALQGLPTSHAATDSVTVDHGSEHGAAEGEILWQASGTQAAIGVTNLHKFWTNAVPGGNNVTPIPWQNDYRGVYASIRALGPDAEGVWEWAWDARYTPTSLSFVVSPSGALNNGLAGTLNVLTIGATMLGASATPDTPQAILKAAEIASKSDEFLAAVTSLYGLDNLGFVQHLYQMLRDPDQANLFRDALGSIGIVAGKKVLAALAERISLLVTIYSLSELVIDMFGALVSDSAQGNVEFTAGGGPTPGTPNPVTDLHNVNWADRTYEATCPDSSITDHPLEVTLHGGAGSVLDGSNGRIDVRLAKMTYGDLNGDGVEEAAALFTCARHAVSPNWYGTEVQVFGVGPHRLATLTPPPAAAHVMFPPRFNGDPFGIRNQLLSTGADYWIRDDPHSDPSIHATLTWRWDGSRFRTTPPKVPPIGGSLPRAPDASTSEGPAGLPDLIPISTSADAGCGVAELNGGIINRSSVPTNPVRVAWAVDGAVVRASTLRDLRPNVAEPGLNIRHSLPPGIHQVTFAVDPSKTIPESNEDNNTWTDTITVADCGTESSAKPSNPTPSQTTKQALDKPRVLTPAAGQALSLHNLTIHVSPVDGASGYLYGFFQNGQPTWENYANEHTLSGTEYRLPDSAYPHFQIGWCDIWVRLRNKSVDRRYHRQGQPGW